MKFVPPSADVTAAAARERGVKETEQPFLPLPKGAFRRIRQVPRGWWLRCQRETGQTVHAFSRISMKAVPHGHVDTVELVPIGHFPPAVDLSLLSEFLALFFGCKCEVAKRLTIASCSEGARQGDEGMLQLNCVTIQDALVHRKRSRHILCSVGVTMCDLYATHGDDDWNFVFGQAEAMSGAGVFSFARYWRRDGGAWLVPWKGDPATKLYDNMTFRDAVRDEEDEGRYHTSILYRAAKVLAHETGHLFGVKHCIFYQCLMCGSNNLEEFDAKPLLLCPIDLKKLYMSCHFDVVERYRHLCAFSDKAGWADQVDWYEKRLAYLTGTAS